MQINGRVLSSQVVLALLFGEGEPGKGWPQVDVEIVTNEELSGASTKTHGKESPRQRGQPAERPGREWGAQGIRCSWKRLEDRAVSPGRNLDPTPRAPLIPGGV